MTDEQNQQIIEAVNQLYDNIKPLIDIIHSIFEKLRRTIIGVIDSIKPILDIKIKTFSRKRKGNRYVINKFNSIPIYKYFMKNRN